jgi:phage tail sheath gpL-like
MTIAFNRIPVNLAVPGTYVEISTPRTDGLVDEPVSLLMVAPPSDNVGLAAYGDVTGLNDLTSGGTFTGTQDAVFEIEVIATGTPDTWRWRKNGGSWSAAVTMSTNAVALSDGVTATFAASTGHTRFATWVIACAAVNYTFDTLSGEITSAAQAQAAYGVSSVLTDMLSVAKAEFPTSRLFGFVQDPGASATLARGFAQTTGGATEAGTLALYYNYRRLGNTDRGRFTVPVEERGNATVGAVTYLPDGSPGLNDLTAGTAYYGWVDDTVTVEIVATGTPDTFRWRLGSYGNWSTAANITAGAMTLAYGITVTFAATTGHTANDQWTFQVTASGGHVALRRLTEVVNQDRTAQITAQLVVPTSSTAGTVMFTAKSRGTIGVASVFVNYLPQDATPGGLTVPAETGLIGGGSDPNANAVLDAIENVQMRHIATAYTNSQAAQITTYLEDAYDGTNPRPGQFWVALGGASYSVLTGTIAPLFNSPIASIQSPYRSPTADWVVAANYAAIAGREFGNDPALQLTDVRVRSMFAPKLADRFTFEENQGLLTSGIATLKYDAAGNSFIQRAVTTYKTNVAGVPDPSYRDTTTPATLIFLARQVQIRIATVFQRFKLASDELENVPVGQRIARPRDIRAELVALFYTLQDRGVIEVTAESLAGLVVQRNPSDVNRVDAILTPDLINQFLIFAARVDPIL